MSAAAQSPTIRPSSWEMISVGVFSLLFLTYTSYDLGVWETWESLHARLIDWMWEHETWLQVNVPLQDERVRTVSELAFGWWPSMLSVHWLAPKLPWLTPELALRLPSILFSSLNLMLIYSLMLRWQNKRLLALISIGFILVMPGFSLMSRHSLNAGGIGTLACLASTLCYMRTHLSRPKVYFCLGTMMMGVSAASLGVIGLLIPLVVYFSGQPKDDTFLNMCKNLCVWVTPILSFVLIFYWRSWVKRGDQIDFWHLFFTLDPLSQPYAFVEWSGFQTSLHLIGFNLFPFGALLPILAISLRSQDSFTEQWQIGRQLLWLFVVTFFTIALISPSSGYWGGGSIILAAPMAIAGACYFLEGNKLKQLPSLYTVSVILFWLLIDSNLKNEPGLMIAALTGDKVKGLLPEFPLWRYGRYLSLLGIILLIHFQTSALHTLWEKIKSWFKTPSKPHHSQTLLIVSLVTGFISIVPHFITVIPKWVVSSGFMTSPFWGTVPHSVRLVTFGVLISLFTYQLIWVSWRLFTDDPCLHVLSRLDVELATLLSWLIITPHYLDRLPMWRFMRPLIPFMENSESHHPKYHMVALIHLGLIFTFITLLIIIRKSFQIAIRAWLHNMMDRIKQWPLWTWPLCTQKVIQQRVTVVGWLSVLIIFTQFNLLQGFSNNFSHQKIIRGYQSMMKSEERLQLYLVNDAEKSFYLSDLPSLDKNGFTDSTQESKRQFYVVGREQLSRANQHYRKSTGKHLPILDDSHHKLLLASNQLLIGEKDRNPIKNAVIDSLPKGVNKLKDPINFDQTIELVGWQLTPSRPRAGAPVKIDLYWRAKRAVRSQWKVFVHIDAPGQRIHADHDPVAGVYPTQDWQAGDLILDRHHITVKRSIKSAVFTFFTGLYRGKTRMKIRNKSKNIKDHDNRAILGKVQVL